MVWNNQAGKPQSDLQLFPSRDPLKLFATDTLDPHLKILQGLQLTGNKKSLFEIKRIRTDVYDYWVPDCLTFHRRLCYSGWNFYPGIHRKRSTVHMYVLWNVLWFFGFNVPDELGVPPEKPTASWTLQERDSGTNSLLRGWAPERLIYLWATIFVCVWSPAAWSPDFAPFWLLLSSYTLGSMTFDDPMSVSTETTGTTFLHALRARMSHKVKARKRDKNVWMKSSQSRIIDDHDWKFCKTALLCTAGKYVYIHQTSYNAGCHLAGDWFAQKQKTLSWYHLR